MVLLSYKSRGCEHELEGQIKLLRTPPIKSIQNLQQYGLHCSPRACLRRPRRRCSSELFDRFLLDNVDKFSRLRTRNQILHPNRARILPRFRICLQSSRRVGHSSPRLPQAATHRVVASLHLHHRLVPVPLRCLRLLNQKTKAQARRAVLIFLHRHYLVLPSLIKSTQASVRFHPRLVLSRRRRRPRPRPLLRGLSM